MGTLLGIILGAGGFWVFSKIRQVRADTGDIKSGTLLINTDTDELFLMGEDGKIHLILDPSALNAHQISQKAVKINNDTIQTFEEGAPISC